MCACMHGKTNWVRKVAFAEVLKGNKGGGIVGRLLQLWREERQKLLRIRSPEGSWS